MAACMIVIAWGARQASHLISMILLAMLLGYSVLPFPRWIMRRFRLGRGWAIASTVTLVGISYSVLSVYLVNAAYRMSAKAPVYGERLRSLYDSLLLWLVAQGIAPSTLSVESLLSPERVMDFARVIIPVALGSVSDLIVISVLSLLFVIEMSEEPNRLRRVAATLSYYGDDVQHFIAASAKAGALTALAILVPLLVIGVDFPVLWCVVYFFLQFIPNLGVALAIVPPTLFALLTLGWERALLVAIAMVVTNVLSASLLNPILLKKAMSISFLEIVLSLMVWGSLLGVAGTLVAIPLTVVIKKVVERSWTMRKQTAAAASH